MNRYSLQKLSWIKAILVLFAALLLTSSAQALELYPIPERLESIFVSLIDTTPPTNYIISLTNNETVSNADFTVIGGAQDNVGVTNVFYSWNGSGWFPAYSIDNFVTWSAPLTFTPGTNVFQVYAVDSSGNFSATNSIKIIYIATAELEVTVAGGKCAITPNYNNATLRIGKAYSMTATAAPGFKFINWSNSLTSAVSTNPILRFTMVSNLAFTATVRDVIKPTNNIVKPTPNLMVSNASYTIVGTAKDNVGLVNVSYSLNGGAWTPAVTTNGFTNWTADVTLNPGTNTILAYSSDATGNNSVTKKVSMVYILTAPLTVSISGGKGTITPNYNGKSLVIGRAYTMAATNAPGFKFIDWTDASDSIISTNHILHFTMASNLAYTANFQDIAKPTVTITSPTNHQAMSYGLTFVTGKASDNVVVTNVYFSVSDGVIWTSAQTTNNWTNWTAMVQLNLGTNTIQAYSVDSSGSNSAIASVTVVLTPTHTNFPIASGSGMNHPQAQIAFDGTNYIVAYQNHPNGLTNGSADVAQFVSTSGQLVGGVVDPQMSGDAPCIAFDGVNYLMSSVTFTGSGSYIQGAFIGTDGTTGSPAQLSQSTTVDNFGTMVYGGGAYFLEWSDGINSGNNGGFDDIYGALIAPDGSTIASDFQIGTRGKLDEAGQGTAAFDGTNFLATWGGASDHMSVEGRIISPSGNLVTDPFIIYTNSSLPAGITLSCAAFDGTKYLVLFGVGLGTGPATNCHIIGRFVTTTGEVLTNKITLTSDLGPQLAPCATFDGTEYLVTWNQGFNPLGAAGATAGSVKARFFDTNGNPITPEFTVFSPSVAGQTALWAPPLFDGDQFFLVGGLGKVSSAAPDLKFSNGILEGARLYTLMGGQPQQQQPNPGDTNLPPIPPVVPVGTNSPPSQGPTMGPTTNLPPPLLPAN